MRSTWPTVRATMIAVLAFLVFELLLLATSGCASGVIDVGYLAAASGDSSRSTWLLEARASTGGLVQLGAAARTHLADAFDQIALAPEVAAVVSAGPFALGARGGLQLLQFDRYGGGWELGTPSPYLSPFLQVRMGGPAWLFVGGTIEYQMHAGGLPNETYYGAQLGLGLGK